MYYRFSSATTRYTKTTQSGQIPELKEDPDRALADLYARPQRRRRALRGSAKRENESDETRS